MRRLIPLSFLLLICNIAAYAADAPDRWRLSVLAAEMSDDHEVWNDVHAGVALGVAYQVRPAWDVELSVADQAYRSPYTQFFSFNMPGTNGGPATVINLPVTTFRRYRVHPVDLVAAHQFLATSRFSPYVRVGARYVQAPSDGTPGGTTFTPVGPAIPIGPGIPVGTPTPGLTPVTVGYHLGNRTDAEAGAGFRFWLTERTAVRIDAVRLLRRSSVDFDPLTRYAAGLSWKF